MMWAWQHCITWTSMLGLDGEKRANEAHRMLEDLREEWGAKETMTEDEMREIVLQGRRELRRLRARLQAATSQEESEMNAEKSAMVVEPPGIPGEGDSAP